MIHVFIFIGIFALNLGFDYFILDQIVPISNPAYIFGAIIGALFGTYFLTKEN